MANASEDLGKLLLRVTVGGLMLFHGLSKLTHGIDFITGLLNGIGLPAGLAYGVYIGEVVGPILMILGWWARAAGLMVAFDMCVAIALANGSRIFTLTQPGGGLAIELQLLYLVGGLAVAFLGAGRWSVSKGTGLWN